MLYDFYDTDKESFHNKKYGGEFNIYHAEKMIFNQQNIVDSRVGDVVLDDDSNKTITITTVAKNNNVSTEETSKENIKQSFLKHWFTKRLFITFAISLLVALVVWWFTSFHPFSGFLLSFLIGTIISVFKGNPDRRYYRIGKTALWGALGITALRIGFSLEWAQKIENGNFKFVIDTFNQYDWLFFLALLVFAGYLFWLDYKKDY